MIIYDTKNLSITSLKDKYIFEISEYIENKIFFDTFINNIKIDNTNNFKITIYADEINTLKYLLSNDKIEEYEYENIFLFLMKQLKSLEANQLTIPIYNLNDIIYFKIGEKYSYYFLNRSYIFDVRMSNKIIIDKLFIKNEFTSNELKKINELPNFDILATASYWSLAKIIEYCLNKIDKTLVDIKYSKLYWALKKCLDRNPNHRYLIFI